MKKGSLLIVWSLLLAMMFGMSVHAATRYGVSDDGPGSIKWHYGRSGTVTLCEGDIISSTEAFTIIVDNESTDVKQSGGSEGMQLAEWTYEGPTQAFGWKVVKYNNAVTVTLTSISAPEEEEETTEVEDDDDDEDDDDEPDVPQKTEEQTFTENLMAEVAAGVKEGDNKTINATRFHSFSAKTLGTLLSNKGVDFTLYFDYEGECFKITIPAGAVLEEGCEWYGPLKLNAMFGRTMIDRSELEAAIKK